MKRKQSKKVVAVSDNELKKVAGGQGIDPKTKLPNYRGPKAGDWIQGKSIAQTDTIDNVDGLP